MSPVFSLIPTSLPYPCRLQPFDSRKTPTSVNFQQWVAEKPSAGVKPVFVDGSEQGAEMEKSEPRGGSVWLRERTFSHSAQQTAGTKQLVLTSHGCPSWGSWSSGPPASSGSLMPLHPKSGSLITLLRGVHQPL